jgi:4-hydroxybenzoyl-CoA reductase subunit beta
MMRLPGFRYVAAKTTQEVLDHLAASPETVRVVAGGTDLWPNMKRRHQSAQVVVGLRDVEELHGIHGEPGGEIRIGAMTSLTDITRNAILRDHYPGFVRAVAAISSPVLRNMGTIGGNICLDTRCTYYNQNEEWRRSIDYCLKEQGKTCWVATKSARCWAISASDSAPLLCAIGARVRLVSPRGEREIPIEELYQDDGIDYLRMQRDELLTELLLPKPAGFTSTYWKLRRRGSIDFPVLGVGAALWRKGNVIEDVRIYLGAVVSAPTLARDACDFLRGEELTEEVIEEAATKARQVASPLNNTDYEIPWRKEMVGRYVEGALRELGGFAPRIHEPDHGLWAVSR